MRTRLTSILLFVMLYSTQAQIESLIKKENIEVGIDFISSYIFRGIQLDAMPNVQGWANYSYGNLILGTRMSANTTGTYSETDVLTSYELASLSVHYIHFFIRNENVFDFNSDSTKHYGGFMLRYHLSESMPLQISFATYIYGLDFKVLDFAENGAPIFSDTRNYSSYIEFSYSFKINDTELSVVAGASTHKSNLYGTNGFGFINTGVDITKSIKLAGGYSVPTTLSITVNPRLEAIYPALKISF